MIKTFSDKKTEDIFHGYFPQGMDKKLAKKARMRLEYLNATTRFIIWQEKQGFEEGVTMVPQNQPTHPGEFVKIDILQELNLTQTELAQLLGLSYKIVNQLVNCKRNMTADVALRLGKFTQTSPELWMNLQITYDLWNAVHLSGKEIDNIQPFMDSR
jgi:addiction module HigA family antidote